MRTPPSAPKAAHGARECGLIEDRPDVFRAGLGRRLPPGYVRIAAITRTPAVLRECGLDAETLLAAEGLPGDVFEHPDNAIPFKAGCALLARCVRETGREDFALMVVERKGASDLGLVGFLLQQASDVRTALGDLARYLHHTDRGASVFLETGGGAAQLGYAIFETDAPGCEQIYDAAISIGRNILHGLCGPKFSLNEVSLSRRKPPYPARYEKFFGAPVHFEAERSALTFDEKWLDAKLPAPDPALRQMLQEQIDLLEAGDADALSEQVRRLLRAVLQRGPASAEDISRLLGLTRRTLTRRLALEGSSYKAISDEAMFEIARQQLAQPTRSITEVALSLHYSEASAFTRAFRQWTGVSPTLWRAQRAGEEAGEEAAGKE